jgi:hypothetical protein
VTPPSSAADAADLEILYEDEVASVGCFDDVQVYRWYAPPTVEALGAVAAVQERHAGSVGGKAAAITVVDVGVGFSLGDEERHAGIATFRKMKELLLCSAFLVEQTGFFASLARSVLFGLTAVARVGYPLKVFGDLESCVAWLDAESQKAGRRPIDREGLTAYVRRFEARR